MIMSLYFIHYSERLSEDSKYNALVAPKHVERTLRSCGAKEVHWHTWTHLPIAKAQSVVWRITDVLQCLLSLSIFHRGDTLLFQFPYPGMMLGLILRLLYLKGVKTVILVHDLHEYRSQEVPSGIKGKIRAFNRASVLLVHTPQMASLLRESGVITRMQPMTLFDYYSDDPFRDETSQIKDRTVIAFAGNLNKSAFLRTMERSLIPGELTIRLYGVEPKTSFANEQMEYCGKFLPEHTGAIEAGWGLVWDGDRLDTCSGLLGRYLTIIAPHKLSLYLACGMPVIVWKKSAHAAFVEENNIGIAVESIFEAYNRIGAMSEADYVEKMKNARVIGEKLRHGEYLKNALHEI